MLLKDNSLNKKYKKLLNHTTRGKVIKHFNPLKSTSNSTLIHPLQYGGVFLLARWRLRIEKDYFGKKFWKLNTGECECVYKAVQ
jgi:hypothetical protein